ETDALDVHGLGAAGGEVGIVGDDLHAEGDGALGDFAADATHADDAEGFAVDFVTAEGLAIPTSGLHGGGGLGDRTGAAKDVRKGELGGGDGVARGGVHHDDTALGGGLDIDIVHADAGAANDLEQRRGGQHLLGDLGLGTHGDGVHVFDQLQNLFRGRAVGLDHFKARLLTQKGDSLG